MIILPCAPLHVSDYCHGMQKKVSVIMKEAVCIQYIKTTATICATHT